jgi:hypothetical protein
MNNYYTYAYLREDGTPYYIGKGKGSRVFSKHKRRKGSLIPVPNKDRILILKKFEDENEAFRHEIYIIDILGRKDLGTGILRNKTNGGDGCSGYKHSEESKKKQSISHTGKKRGTPSEETKEKIRKSNLGKPSWNKGLKFPNSINEKTRKKMRESHLGKKLSKETIEKRTKTRCKKMYKIISPDNVEYYSNNVREFCKEHNLNGSNMYNVLNEKQKSHKGWTITLAA